MELVHLIPLVSFLLRKTRNEGLQGKWDGPRRREGGVFPRETVWLKGPEFVDSTSLKMGQACIRLHHLGASWSMSEP